jgi:PAP2 superfamily
MTQSSFPARHILGLLLSAILAVTVSSPPVTARAAPAGPQSVITWNTIALRTVVTVGGQPPAPAFVYAAYVQAAVYNAVVAIEGGYQPYNSQIAAQPGASVDTAVAAAAHGVLVYYFPLQQAALDADYATALAAIPDGSAKTAGISVGNAAAEELIALRQGDGLNANIGFTMPAPAPGVWQLPAGVNPQAPWMSRFRPFMLESPDQFRPGPPPDLSSTEWATEYNEVLLYGRRDSTVRTPEQTTIARFWSSVPLVQYNLAFQGVASSAGLNAVEAARLMAMGDMVGADALIGCFDAKYHYLFWRPAYAIPLGDTDGNPDTVGDPTFVPLLPTPPHPEYPSAHGCVTSAEAEMFSEFLGTQHINVDIPSTVPGIGARHFTNVNDLTQEIINARVWAGIHYRESVVTGVNLGRKVAHWTLQRYFLPVP